LRGELVGFSLPRSIPRDQALPRADGGRRGRRSSQALCFPWRTGIRLGEGL